MLEETQQSAAARAEYRAYLNLGQDDKDGTLRGAVEQAIERDVLLLDAAMRLAHLKAKDAKTPADAEDAAGLLAGLVPIAERGGIQRPQLDYEQGEALRRAYILSNSEKNLARAGKTPQLAASEDLTDREDLFYNADMHYRRMAGSALSEDHRTSLRSMIGYLGRGELYLTRVKVLQNQVNKEFTDALGLDAAAKEGAQQAGTTKNGGAAKNNAHGPATGKAGPDENKSAIANVLRSTDPGEAFRYDPSKVQAYLEMLKQYKDKLKDGRAKGFKPQPERLCRLLATIVASLKTATESFDEAIALNRDLPEAHRDRGAAYLARRKPSRCWPTSSASTPN